MNVTDTNPSDDQPDTLPAHRRLDRSMLASSIVVAVGLAFVIRGLLGGITGQDAVVLPNLVEQVEPVPTAVQALSQTRVFADLASGYTGVFVIDGIEIITVDVGDLAAIAAEPGDQVDLPPETIYEAGNSTLTFVPADGAQIEKFASGEHTVELLYWKAADGRQRELSFIWTFSVV